MKLLALAANPRKNGYTGRLFSLFLRGAAEAGADIEEVDLFSIRLEPCRGCYRCWLADPGKCVISDGMEQLLAMYGRADLLAVATPVYMYGINSELKKFFERCFPLMRPGIEFCPSGMERNKLRRPGAGPKAMAALITGAMRSKPGFAPAAANLALAAETLGMRCAGVLVRPETYMFDFEPARPKQIAEIEQALVRAGAEFARNAPISDSTLKTASTPLSEDLTAFQRYANIYWEHAERMGAAAVDLEAVKKRVLRDVRILVPEMARKADCSALPREKLTIGFHFPDKSLAYLMVLDKTGANRVVEDDQANPADIRITCAAETWAGIMYRELSPARVLAEKQVAIEGDASIFRSFERIFPWNA